MPAMYSLATGSFTSGYRVVIVLLELYIVLADSMQAVLAVTSDTANHYESQQASTRQQSRPKKHD